MVQQGGQGALADASAGLRGIAIVLTKIANDIRLLASGPSCGTASCCSRAPGRVVDHAGQGQPGDLRVRQPGRGPRLRQRRDRRRTPRHRDPRAQHVLAGDGGRPARVGACSPTSVGSSRSSASPASRSTSSDAANFAERTSALATALNPIIGYAKAAELVKTAVQQRRSIIDVAIEAGVLDEAEARRVLDPMAMTALAAQ